MSKYVISARVDARLNARKKRAQMMSLAGAAASIAIVACAAFAVDGITNNKNKHSNVADAHDVYTFYQPSKVAPAVNQPTAQVAVLSVQ